MGTTQEGTGRTPPSQSCKVPGATPNIAENSAFVRPAFSIWPRRAPGGSAWAFSFGNDQFTSPCDSFLRAREGEAAGADGVWLFRAATAASSDSSSSSSVNGVRGFLLQSLNVRTSSKKEKNRALFYLPRLLTTLVLLVFLSGAVAVLLYETVPMRNTTRTSFDAIIVLGSPANPDGTPSHDQWERVGEGVREFRAGVAPRLIMTGGAAHNRYVEAHIMAQLAEAEGVPAAGVIEEGHAKDTIQNAYYSVQIMQAHGGIRLKW